MKRWRILVGMLAWLVAGTALCWWLRGSVLAPDTDGHRLATELWRYVSAQRRMVRIQLDGSLPIDVGDPIYRISGPQAVEQVGEIRRILVHDDPAVGTSGGVTAEALLYPNAPRVGVESYLTYYTTPRSLSWVMETMLPPEKRFQIAEEIVNTYEPYHAEILQAMKPVIVGGLLDAMQVVEEDLAEAVSRRRESLEQLGRRYQDRVVSQELVPLIRQQVWPIVKKHVEPLANQIGEEMFERASLWRFGWRLLYDKSPFPEKDLTRAEWNRFVSEEALPVLNSHAEDILAFQRRVFEEVMSNERVQEALHRNLSQVVDDPEFRTIAWEILREVLVDNARLRNKLEERWSGEEARRAMQLAADYAEPCLRRIGDLLLGTREAGISPEFAQVLRNQILDKDCRWLVLETPPPATPPELERESERECADVAWRTALHVRQGGYPPVNPFAVQLQGVRP
ncbi:MAG: hypothetical protein ACYC3X_17955 [Pirellulaceae bacterium]